MNIYSGYIVIAVACLLTIFTACIFAEDGDFLIIYHSSLASNALDNLIAFESSRGFTCLTHSIDDGISRDSIKAIILNRYKNAYRHPRYVLLVGSARRSIDPAETISNASQGNLIPTFYHIDSWGGKASYDYDYSVMCENTDGAAFHEAHPMVALGRIPAVDSIDLLHYVEKLTYYYNDDTPADWKNNVLVLYGDKDRGAISGLCQ